MTGRLSQRPNSAIAEARRLLDAAPAAVRVVGVGAPLPPDGARSYLGDGRMVLWAPAKPGRLRLAVDAEIGGRPVPRQLAARYRTSDPDMFWPRWTAVEVSCKLRDVPLPMWLREYGLHSDQGLVLRTFGLADLVISCGALAGAR